MHPAFRSSGSIIHYYIYNACMLHHIPACKAVVSTPQSYITICLGSKFPQLTHWCTMNVDWRACMQALPTMMWFAATSFRPPLRPQVLLQAVRWSLWLMSSSRVMPPELQIKKTCLHTNQDHASFLANGYSFICSPACSRCAWKVMPINEAAGEVYLCSSAWRWSRDEFHYTKM